MFAAAWKLLTSRLAGPVLGVALVASVAGNAYQFIRDKIVIGGLRDDVTALQSKNDGLTRDNQTLRINQATLKSSIETQNTAITGLKTAAEQSEATAKAASAAAAAAASAERASRVATINAATPGADRCASASQLIRNTLASEHSK